MERSSYYNFTGWMHASSVSACNIVDLTEYSECFEKKNMFYVFNLICRPQAEQRVTEEPGYDYCKSVCCTESLKYDCNDLLPDNCHSCI